MFKHLLIFSLMAFALASCLNEEEPVDQVAVDDQAIQEYLDVNGLQAEKTDLGLYFIIDVEGNGEVPELTDTVTVHYEGRLLNDQVFDSSYDRGEPLEIRLNQVIPGWQVGIPLFSKGGSGTLFIPSWLAYGRQSVGSIPPNSVLIFDVELIDFR